MMPMWMDSAKTLLTPSLNMKPGGREEAKEGDNGSPVNQPTQLQNPGHAAQLFGIGIVFDWTELPPGRH